MWTVAALNKKYSDALGTYNSLQDPHLHQYFRKPQIRHHLIQAGLITFEGKVIPEALVRLRKLEDERRQQLHDLLSEVLENGRTNKNGLRKLRQTQTLESEAKLELVERAKKAFNNANSVTNASSKTQSTLNSSNSVKKSSQSTVSSINWFRKVSSLRSRTLSTVKAAKKKHVRIGATRKLHRPKSSYGIRSNRVLPDVKLDDELLEELSAIVSLDGDSIHDSDNEANDKNKMKRSTSGTNITLQFNGLTANSVQPRMIRITQQLYSGGNAIIIFNRLIKPGEIFTFTSRTHGNYPFCLTILVDEIRDLRISTCCEHKHTKGCKLSHFTLIEVSGGKQCNNCLYNHTTEKFSVMKMRNNNNNNNNNNNETITDNGISDNSGQKTVQELNKDYSSDSDFEDNHQTVIENNNNNNSKQSLSSKSSNENYNSDQFEAYDSSVESPSLVNAYSAASNVDYSSDDNSVTAKQQHVVEVDVHVNP